MYKAQFYFNTSQANSTFFEESPYSFYTYIQLFSICKVFILSALLLPLALFSNAEAQGSLTTSSTNSPIQNLTIQKIFPHKSRGFTQGLVFLNNQLWESNGLYGQSSLCVQSLASNYFSCQKIPDQYFAEGLAYLDSVFFQLTWREGKALRYSLPKPNSTLPLKTLPALNYAGEGWGLTVLNKKLYLSNGTDTLYAYTSSFKLIKKVAIKLGGQALNRLNELETIGPYILANRWFDTNIYLIHPITGSVLRTYNAQPLVANESPTDNNSVLNGLAYDSSTGNLYITGKNWKNIYQTKISLP